MTSRPSVCSTGLVRHRLAPRDTLRAACREFLTAYDKVFLAKRPWLRRENRDWCGGGPKAARAPRPVLAVPFCAERTVIGVARFYLGLETPPRGTLAALCRQAGVRYHSVTAALQKIKSGERPLAISAAKIARAMACQRVAQTYLALPRAARYGKLPRLCAKAGVNINTARACLASLRAARRSEGVAA